MPPMPEFRWRCPEPLGIVAQPKGRGEPAERGGAMKRFCSPSSPRCCWAAVWRIRRWRETRWDAEGLFLRQPGHHVDPRGIDHRRPGPDDGRIQQPRDVRPERAAKRAEVDRARPRQRMVVERGAAPALTFKLRRGVKWHDGKPFTAQRRQMHLRSAAGQGDRDSCASIRARRGTATSTRSSSRPTTR